MTPGDACMLIGGSLVEHVAPCPDGHRSGVVTDVRTGEVVRLPERVTA